MKRVIHGFDATGKRKAVALQPPPPVRKPRRKRAKVKPRHEVPA